MKADAKMSDEINYTLFFTRTNFIRLAKLKLVKDKNKLKTFRGWEVQKQQEVGGDLSVCVLNISPKVSSPPSLLAMHLVKVEI